MLLMFPEWCSVSWGKCVYPCVSECVYQHRHTCNWVCPQKQVVGGCLFTVRLCLRLCIWKWVVLPLGCVCVCVSVCVPQCMINAGCLRPSSEHFCSLCSLCCLDKAAVAPSSCHVCPWTEHCKIACVLWWRQEFVQQHFNKCTSFLWCVRRWNNEGWRCVPLLLHIVFLKQWKSCWPQKANDPSLTPQAKKSTEEFGVGD